MTVAIETQYPRVEVEIDGVRRTTFGGACTLSARGFNSVATIQLDTAEGVPEVGATVRVRAVRDGAALRVIFTGEIDEDGVDLQPNTVSIACSGVLGRVSDPIGEAPDVNDGESDPEPVVTYSGQTGSEIIGDILERYGITEYDLQDTGATYGNLDPIGLAADQPGEELIKQLDDEEFHRTYVGPDGVVRRVPWRWVPGAQTARTWTQDQDLVAGQYRESRRGVKNRIIRTGIPQQGTTGLDILPTGVREAKSRHVPSPPTYRAESTRSALAETGDQCEEWAGIRLSETNRLSGDLPFTLIEPDVDLQPGMTVAVEAARLPIPDGVRFLADEVTHDWSQGLRTSGSLYAATRGSGWSPNLAPTPAITGKAHRERLADGTDQVEVFLDGTASVDPELGADGIASYLWSGTPVTPTPTGDGRTAVAVYPGGIPAGATVTLTCVDVLGKSGSLTIPVGGKTIPVVTRDLISAEKIRLQVSQDGQRVWRDILDENGDPIPAVGTCQVAAEEYTFAWSASGDVWKVLADNTATLVLSGAGVTWVSISLDANGRKTGRVWAGAFDGSTHVSRADGDAGSWVTAAAAPDGGPVYFIEESPFAEGQLYMGANRRVYSTFDNATSWTLVYEHPNTALAAYRWASGFDQGWVGFSGPDGDDAGASRLRERSGFPDLDWETADKPVSIAGLAFDVFEQVLYIVDVAEDGTGRAWRVPADVSGTPTAGTYPHGTVGAPRHMVRDGGMPALLYIAAESALAKSVDGLETVQVLKTLSGGAEGCMVGYGPERKIVRLAGSVLYAQVDTATDDHYLWRFRDGEWSQATLPTTDGVHGFYHAPGDSRLWHIDAADVAGGGLHLSDDEADTWSTVSDPLLSGYQATDVWPLAGGGALVTLLEAGGDPGPSGTLHARIVHFDGAAWSALYTGPASGTAQPSFARIKASEDGLHIVAMGYRGGTHRGIVSGDGGGSWTNLPNMIICAWGGDFALMGDGTIIGAFNPVSAGLRLYASPWSGGTHVGWSEINSASPSSSDQTAIELEDGNFSLSSDPAHWIVAPDGTLVEDVAYPTGASHVTAIAHSPAGPFYRAEWSVVEYPATSGQYQGPVYRREIDGTTWTSLDPDGFRALLASLGLGSATLRCAGQRWLVDMG